MDWCSYKRKLGQTHTVGRPCENTETDTHTVGRPCETEDGHLQAEEKGPQKKSILLPSCSWSSSLQNCKEIDSRYFHNQCMVLR